MRDPTDGSPPGSPVPGIFQARTLEWVAISFSNAWKWKAKVKSLSRVRLLSTPRTAAYQAPPSMGFSRQEYWSGVPLPSPESCLRPVNFPHAILLVASVLLLPLQHLWYVNKPLLVIVNIVYPINIFVNGGPPEWYWLKPRCYLVSSLGFIRNTSMDPSRINT